MASTLTDSGELTFLSFPIEKTETTEDGDLIVYGKASDGSVDSDQQIVDPQWMSKAVQEWLGTGANLRVQHNPQLYPAGVGLEASTDGAGATWVKGLIVEPTAKKLVAKGALRAYSVGIARPNIERDMTAKGGRITNGELVEISLVDRPANKRCGIQLVKSVDGAPEYTGEVFGEDEDIAKALNGDLVKTATVTEGKQYEDTPGRVDISMPEDMSFTFTPNDLAKILKNKFIEQHYDELGKQALYDAEAEVYKRDVNTDERRSLASQGHALPDGSYPIANTGDLSNAAHLAATGHGNAEAAKKLIARRAKELGVANPLSENSSDKSSVITLEDGTEIIDETNEKEAEPVVTKKPPKKGGKKMPPWLQGDKKDGDGSGSDDDDSKKADEPEAVKDADAEAEKGLKDTPQAASGAKDAHEMKPAPLPEYLHSPMPAGRNTPDHKSADADLHSTPEIAALIRFKTVGIDVDLGRLHDLSCPAFHPETVAKYHPFADFSSVVDENVFQRKALEAAAGKSLEYAKEMTNVWQAAWTLKHADQGSLNDLRVEAHKAFRDANPGPTSYPSPGCIHPDKFKRPVITDGRSANSGGYGSPNTSPSVASGPVTGAGGFDRPPLSAGHQTPSPSFMKNNFEVPQGADGYPQRIQYAHMEKEQELVALSRLHTHLMSMVPNVCPMDMNTMGPLDRNPAIGAVGKDVVPEAVKAEEVAKDDHAEVLKFLLEKGNKKMRKKLGKKVLSGKMTVDEARSRIGRNVAMKADGNEELLGWLDEAVTKGVLTPGEARTKWRLAETAAVQEALVKAATSETVVLPPAEPATKAAEPDLVKRFDERFDEFKSLLTAQQKTFEEKIAEQQKVIDAIGNAPDPRGEPWSGLAMNPIKKSSRPAAAVDQAEIAARSQQMMLRSLEHTWNTSDNPAEREAAYKAIQKMRGLGD